MYALEKREKGYSQMIITIEETEEITEEDTKIDNDVCTIFVSGSIEQKKEKCIHELLRVYAHLD